VTALVLQARFGMVTALQYEVLRLIRPSGQSHLTGQAYEGRAKLDVLLGDLLDDIQGRLVIDLGCGDGHETIELARRGAARVIGVDINLECLERARRNTQDAGLSNLIEFSTDAGCPADIVVSLDSFEHFAEPEAMLEHIHGLLRPGGAVISSFGPTWYHPFGGHLFSVFPWAHLVFSERALIRWRSDHRTDGKKSFAEAGLNRMTVKRFLRLARTSRFQIERLELVPIRRVKRFHNRLTREFFTSIVRCKLRKLLAA
jgi:2-polyprenyl-3-methyl-5-hydroxy-6-metoxy-1,4-benzoquinol methylase